MFFIYFFLINFYFLYRRWRQRIPVSKENRPIDPTSLSNPISRNMRSMGTASTLQLEKWLPSKRMRVRLVGFGSAIPGSSNPVDTV